MAHWITTHNPHPVSDWVPWHIYFRKLPKTVPTPGDHVLFYETEDPLPERGIPGRKAIVCSATVSGTLGPMKGIEPWIHQIPCTEHRFDVHVPLDAIRKVVRGPFYKKTLRSITAEQFEELLRMHP